MTKDRKDGKPYVSSVYVQQLDEKNKPKKAYVDAQYDGATLIDGVNYNLIISAVTNGAKDCLLYTSLLPTFGKPTIPSFIIVLLCLF